MRVASLKFAAFLNDSADLFHSHSLCQKNFTVEITARFFCVRNAPLSIEFSS